MTIEKARRVLKEIKNTAVQSSLTGSLTHGSGMLIKAYNEIFRHAVSQQWIANDGIITEINENELGEGGKRGRHMDYLGCAAGLLMALLEDS